MYYTLMIEGYNQQYFLHKTASQNNLLFNVCLASAKTWKKKSTAQKWANNCIGAVDIVEVIYHEEYHYPTGVKK